MLIYQKLHFKNNLLDLEVLICTINKTTPGAM